MSDETLEKLNFELTSQNRILKEALEFIQRCLSTHEQANHKCCVMRAHRALQSCESVVIIREKTE